MDNATGAMPEAPTVATVGATLAVDIGSLYTRAALFDVVGDEYRFIARAVAITTTEAPYNDVTSGVYNAIMELEQITGRKLTEETRLLMPQRRDGNGLDLFIATSSAAPALRLMLAAVSSDISQVSAMQAVQSTYTHIVGRITLDEGLHEIPSEDDALLSTAATAWFQEQTDKLLALPPDVVLIAGGVDNGPVAPLMRLAQVVSSAAREQSSRAERVARVGKSAPGMPSVIFAGNPAALESVKRALAPIPEVQGVPNVRPELGAEQIGPAEDALSGIYREQRVPQIPGYSQLSRWVEGRIVPTAECERLIARYLHAHYGRETLVADVGATSTSLFLASEGRDQAVVLGDVGLAYGLGNLLAERGVENVLRWLPFDMGKEELTDWALNKVVRPLSLPQTARDLAIEQALAREALAAAAIRLHDAKTPPRYDLLIGTGGLLAHAPRPGQAALILLDALQPTAEGLGSVELAIDSTLLIPALGNLARHHLAAAAYIFDRDCLVWLGTAIVVQGEPPEPTSGARRGLDAARLPTAVTVTVERQQGGSETVEVPYGSIQVIPLRPDQRAALTVKPGPGFNVGGGEPGKPLKTQPGQEVKGGLVGLIVDARGRPLYPPTGVDTRSTVRRWWSSLDAIPSGETFQTGPFAPPQQEQTD
ncbi:MAG TPA: glutamate mutase L [Chloroflexia bacterium]